MAAASFGGAISWCPALGRKCATSLLPGPVGVLKSTSTPESRWSCESVIAKSALRIWASRKPVRLIRRSSAVSTAAGGGKIGRMKMNVGNWFVPIRVLNVGSPASRAASIFSRCTPADAKFAPSVTGLFSGEENRRGKYSSRDGDGTQTPSVVNSRMTGLGAPARRSSSSKATRSDARTRGAQCSANSGIPCDRSSPAAASTWFVIVSGVGSNSLCTEVSSRA